MRGPPLLLQKPHKRLNTSTIQGWNMHNIWWGNSKIICLIWCGILTSVSFISSLVKVVIGYSFVMLVNNSLTLLFSYLQDRISLSILQFMSPWEGSWNWLFSLHDMQLLPGDEVSEPQVSGERFRNKLSYLLWFLVHIKCCSQSSTLWPFHAFSLLSGFY